jgi:hypothetical protein
MELMDDIATDRQASWVPDVAADVDIPYLATGVTSGREIPFAPLIVPKPGGSQMQVPVLHPALIVQLHRAVAPLRRVADRTLGEGVFSYRQGADRNWRYSSAWRVFSEAAAQGSAKVQTVIFTDVADFFRSTSWTSVLHSASSLVENQSVGDLRDVAARLSTAGLGHLPSGYSDARLLGNIVLQQAERKLSVGFVRWVDDYRLFASSEGQARQALSELSQGLNTLGLTLNRSKTRMLPGPIAKAEIRSGMIPVFSTQLDSSAVVREKMIGALHYCAEKPIERRSELRYALAGLTREREACFIDWAIKALWQIPWEIPRLVGYLASVAVDPRVAPAADMALGQAAKEVDPWRVSRLAPLVIHTCGGGVSRRTLTALVDALPGLEGSPGWGLALRILARAECGQIVQRALAGRILDVRAAMVALRDLDLSLPARFCAVEPALAEALRYVPAPAPAVKTLL